jgi:hypothetical protein
MSMNKKRLGKAWNLENPKLISIMFQKLPLKRKMYHLKLFSFLIMSTNKKIPKAWKKKLYSKSNSSSTVNPEV